MRAGLIASPRSVGTIRARRRPFAYAQRTRARPPPLSRSRFPITRVLTVHSCAAIFKSNKVLRPTTAAKAHGAYCCARVHYQTFRWAVDRTYTYKYMCVCTRIRVGRNRASVWWYFILCRGEKTRGKRSMATTRLGGRQGSRNFNDLISVFVLELERVKRTD